MAGTATKLHVHDCGSSSCAFNGAHLRSDYEGLEFETVSGDTGFLPGVTLIEAPGHTPGTMALRVDLADEGTMLFTSDAVYMGDSYGPPATPAASANDLSQWYASVEKLRGIAEQLWSLRRSPDGHYT
jgi:glyoxylase-like metal-dependent hydrolase (beta-lactamase superfamily II)